MRRGHCTSGSRRRRRSGLFGVLAVTAISLAASPAPAAAPEPGSAGTDTSLPASDSQATVRGRGAFAGLEVTVNQTAKLANQAVSVTWTGGAPTTTGSSRYDGNYMQIMQCWGDDDGSTPDNPGPPPEQCVQGATDAVYGGRNAALFPGGGLTLERIISRRSGPDFDPTKGHFDARTGYVWKPFRPVDGPVVGVHYDPEFNPVLVGGSYWLNPYFNSITTNEIAGGRTAPNGKGAELFEVTTGVESSGLGCGQRVQPVPGGSPKVPKCWLVVVPRGSPASENEGSGFGAEFGVFTSPLSPRSWQNRIAIPLEFNPVDTPCALSDEQRRIVGNELVAPAVSSWQPKLCSIPGVPPYAYGVLSDTRARQQLTTRAPGSPGMVVVSRPIPSTTLDPDSPVVYAPLTLSASVIGFNIERNPNDKDPEALPLKGVRVARLNLTPRLVAKLLTQSYASQVAIKTRPPYAWAETNPAHLGQDPDFLQFNPEFNLLQTAGGKNMGGLVMPSIGSDAARQVWEWVLADPEAKSWLDGAADPWKMVVNPIYATKATANSTGAAFGDPIPDTFPKSDPHCYSAPPQGALIPPPLCGPDWLPYTQSAQEAARLTRAANDGARTTGDPFAASADRFYRPDGPQILGSRSILSLTDSASAVRYGVQMARLSRAGDNGPERAFIAPDDAGLSGGVEAMRSKDVAQVLEPNPVGAPSGAYPLTALSYAAVPPLTLDDQARREYASFVDYAAGPGQVQGQDLGQLPEGYTPLPQRLRTQATLAAKAIREMQPPPPPPPPEPPAEEVAPPPAVEASMQSDVVTRVASAPPPASASGSSPRRSAPVTASVSAAALPRALVEPANASPASESRAISLVTPIIALGRNRFALPGLAVIAILSALGALEITKRPRRIPADTVDLR